MYRPTRFSALVLAALALAGCSGGSTPMDPVDASVRSASSAPADSAADSTTSAGEEGATERGVYTLGGGN